MEEKGTDYLKLYNIAENQAGYFTNKQAEEAGFSRDLLAHLTTSGKFLRLRRGLYRLRTFPEMPYSDYYQVWIAKGLKGVFSHRSALALYELTDLIPTQFHLMFHRPPWRKIQNTRYHTAKLKAEEVTTRHGLPVTDIPRTLYDLYRSRESPEWIIQAAQQALERGMISEGRLMQRIQTYSQAFQRFMKEVLEKRETS